MVVDGGAPQVAAAQAVLSELGITDVTLVGLAKRLEEVWVPDEDHPVILPRTSEALYLLQRVRDEAHRFAITFHRQKRSKSMTESAAGRHRRPRPGSPQGAVEAVLLAEAAAGGHAWTRSPRCQASARNWPSGCTTNWPARPSRNRRST